MSGQLQMVDGWGNARAPTPVGTSPRRSLYPRDGHESSPFSRTNVLPFYTSPRSGGAAPPPSVGAADRDRDAEARGHAGRGHDVGKGSRRQEGTV